MNNGSDDRFMEVFRASSDAILIIDNGKFVDCNDAAAKMLGYAGRDEFKAASPAEVSPPMQPDGKTSAEESAEMLDAAVKQGAYHFEWVHQDIHGREFPVEVTLTNVAAHTKDVMLCVWRDISEQKAAIKALKESERRLAAIFDFLPDGTFAIDRNGCVIAWNHAIEEITGIPASKMLGKGNYEYSIPLYGKRMPIVIDMVREGHEELWKNYDFIERRGDQIIAERFLPALYGGRGAYIWGIVSPLYDSEGRIAGAIESFRDISEQKRDKEALRANETKYRTIYNASLDGILLRTLDRTILSANRAAVAMFGYDSEEELKGVPLERLYPERQSDGILTVEKARRTTELAIANGSATFEWDYYRKDGSLFYARITIAMMTINGERLMLNTIRDITKERLAEEALRASEAKYKTLYDSATDAILLRTPDRRIVSGNPTAVKLFGYKDEAELIATPPAELYPEFQPNGLPSDEHAARAMEQALKDGTTTLEWCYRRKDGSTFDATISIASVNISGTSFILTTIHDITEQKRAQEAVRASETKYRTLFDSSSDAILLRTTDRNILGANRAAIALFGCKDEAELRAMTPKDFYPQRQPDGALSEEKAAEMADIALRDGSHTFEWLYRRKDGSEFLANVLWTQMVINGRQILLTTIRDITKQRRAEEALRATERRLRLFADNMTDLIWTMDLSGNITYASPAAQRLLGYSPDELSKCNLKDVLTPDSFATASTLLEQADPKISRENRPTGGTIELVHVRKNGTTVATETSYTAMYDESGCIVAVQGITRDITQRKIADAELAQARDEAQAANRAKSAFLAMMSHEIRTPLNAIVGMTGLLLDTQMNAEQRECCETIRTSSEVLLALINDVLDFSKIEADRMELERQPFDATRCIEDAVDLVSARAAEKQLEVAVQIAPNLPDCFLGDVGRLRQILVNLLSNAVKFTDQGEIIVSLTGRPHEGDSYTLEFAVHDTGVGIPRDRQDRLFQSFSQLDVSTNRRFGGTGLGLAISKRLCGLMGGHMWAESTGVPGEGATFRFTIETVATPGPCPSEQPAVRYDPALLAGKRVLIVDDNKTSRDIFSAQTMQWNMTPVTATAAKEALELLERGEAFDVAILDMRMPEMSGAALAQTIKQIPTAASMPLILVSSLSQRLEEKDAAAFAIQLAKPVRKSQLCDVLCRVLGATSQEPRETVQPAAPPANGTAAQQHSSRVLLAEDNPINQKVAIRMLEKLGYRADVVANGLEAVDACKMVQYDIILMDCQMPDMDGYEATRHIRELERKEGSRPSHIIAMTANAMQGDRELCLAAGMDDYLGKPVRINELQETLARCAAAK